MRYNHEEQGDDIEGDMLLVITVQDEDDKAVGLPAVYQFSCLGCALESIQEAYNTLSPEHTLDIQLVALKTEAYVKGESNEEVH